MIIRNVDGKVFVIPDVSVEQEEEFELEKSLRLSNIKK